MRLIETNVKGILQLCNAYKVKTLYVLGSILTPRFNEKSDVDFFVKFQKDEIELDSYADNFFDFQFALENLFGRKVDLVCEDVIRNPIFKQEVNATKQLIYG